MARCWCSQCTVLTYTENTDTGGGDVTITNLGASGVESFTPILNMPQVAILGIGCVHLKPIEEDGAVKFVPHVGLSLTIDHQVVDGGPAARFLKTLAANVRDVDLLVFTL